MKRETHDLGRYVQCDGCDKVYRTENGTVLDESKGGIMLLSKALCPACAPRAEADAKRYGETQYIRDRCPPEMRFVDWVDQLRRGENARVTITEF